MKTKPLFIYLLWFLFCCVLMANSQKINSSGALQFKCDGQIFTADNTHARAYALTQNNNAFLKAANADKLVLSIEWVVNNGKGIYIITNADATAYFTLNHKTYNLKNKGSFIKIEVNNIKTEGSFFLLSGTFSGLLQDKAGNKINITEGNFNTLSL